MEKRLGVVVHTCPDSYSSLPKVGGLCSRPPLAKSKKGRPKRTGGVTLEAEHLPIKHKALISSPRTEGKKREREVYTYKCLC
jgi:hypothetical protein